MKQCDLTKGLVFFLTIIITLCCGLIPSSWAEDDAVCTNKKLNGQYSFSQSGLISVPSLGYSKPVPVGSVGSFIADGKGHIISGNEILQLGEYTINAVILEGTYDLEENCTGTASIDVSAEVGPSPLRMEIAITITNDGKEVHLLTTSIINLTNPSNVMQPFAMTGFGTRGTDD
ncbi:MAG: hypothetical protein ACNYWU_09605 [Desulfobacterales bacterium]